MTTPTVKLCLDIRQGLGFDFLKECIILNCSLLDDVIVTDQINPSDPADFESKLIWKIDTDTYQRLSMHDIPIKINVLTAKKKRLIGYIHISILTAEICSSDEKIKIKCTWHKLNGIKYSRKSSNPRLQLSLVLEETLNSSILSPKKIRNVQDIPVLKCSISNSDTMSTIKLGEERDEKFMLTFNITKFENEELLYPSTKPNIDENLIHFSITVFSKDLLLKLNERENINIESSMQFMYEYLKNNPFIIIRYCNDKNDIGHCCFDLRKIVPTNNTSDFLIDFCDSSEAFCIKERCFIINSSSGDIPTDSNGNKPFIEIEVVLKFLNRIDIKKLGDKKDIKPKNNSPSDSKNHTVKNEDFHIANEILNNNSDELVISEITEESKIDNVNKKIAVKTDVNQSPRLKEVNILQIVNELEDWKEYQQELFKGNLREKETNFLNELDIEWQSKRNEHELELIQNIEYCHNLIRSLNEIIDNLKIRETQIEHKEKSLLNAKDELKMVYKMKYQELMDASNKMQFDCEHQLQLHKIKYAQLINEVKLLSQENARLKDSLQIVDSIKNEIFMD